MPPSPDNPRRIRYRASLRSVARPWRILLPAATWESARTPSSVMLVYGFAGMIAVGTIILMLPVSSASGRSTPFIDALFTATSSVCVTGLVVTDTLEHWNSWGHLLILIMIQLGGFGFMASTTLFLLAFRQRIGLRERLLIRESVGVKQLGGLDSLVKKMAIFTLVAELLGAMMLYSRFASDNDTPTAILRSFFHSVSAFNNAGFDLSGKYQSFLAYQTDSLMLLTTAGLVFLGGISYLLVADAIVCRGLRRLSLESKLVLTTTVILLSLGTIVILVTEFGDPQTIGNLPLPAKLLNAFFMSVTARTAGFSTVDISQIADYGLFFLMLLMFIGGASGSTAGGIKVNTLGLLAATISSTIRGKEYPGAFGREFSAEQINRALTVIMLSAGFIALAVFFLTMIEPFGFIHLLFETVSAFGTVGLSTGITRSLTASGKLIIIITMFVGRLGPLALVLALTQRQSQVDFRYPKENIRIG